MKKGHTILIVLVGFCLIGIGKVHATTYYAVENLETSQVIRRGVSGSQGITANELILGPETLFRVWVYDPDKKMIGHRDFFTPTAGLRFSLDTVPLRIGRTQDSDHDGLSDDAEFVLGSNALESDSDGDGIADGAAIALGLNPVTGVLTGIIGGTVPTGSTMDVVTRNDVAVTANGPAGVTIFNIFNQLPPIIIGQVDTPGDARRVAMANDYVAVADGPPGLMVINIREPAMASLIHQVPFGLDTVAVAASAGTGYVALEDGQLVAVDLASGIIRHRLTLPEPARDLGIGGNVLYAVGQAQLHVVPLTPGAFSLSRSVTLPQELSGNHLFVGSRLIYVPHTTGYNLFDLSNPLEPVALPGIFTAQRLWQFVVANGSGLALASYDDPGVPLDQSFNLYDVGPDGRQNSYLTSFAAAARIQSAAIYNGQGFLAAGDAGLLVLNYLAVDVAGVPPTIQLFSTAFADGVEAGQPVLVRAEVSDDVQVRNVEFYQDGRKLATDGSHPFEHRFRAPQFSGSSSFNMQARVSDTGGNVTWSTVGSAALQPDRTPPEVLASIPAAGGIAVSPTVVTIFFNESVVPESLTSSTLQLFQTGPDGILGNGDDVAVTGFSIVPAGDGFTMTLVLSAPLSAGRHLLVVEPGVIDLAGNVSSSPYQAFFTVIDGIDDDGDGIPNDVELLLGLNPNNADTDADGIPDGLEDPDVDGLGIASELVLGTNPALTDTDDNGVVDGQEDFDLDGVTNQDEFAQGLDPFRNDTDGDGYYDEAELTGGSNPLDAGSRPHGSISAAPPATLLRPSSTPSTAEIATNAVIAAPPLQFNTLTE